MYKHILVPLDASLLSADVVSEAVEFARVLGACLTFLHVRDDGASNLLGDAALLRTVSPDKFAEIFEWKVRTVLSKAEAGARARNVPHQAMWVTSASPGNAIIKAAEEQECDLIMMATHGHGNFISAVFGSVTLRVLQNSPVPVLVCGTGQSTSTPATKALSAIKDEHLSLAAVVDALGHIVQRAGLAAEPGDEQIIEAIISYLREFPERLHHPKEEAYLFQKLGVRYPERKAEICELCQQHKREKELLADLEGAFAAYRRAHSEGEALRRAVGAFVEHVVAHIALEETAILPAARQHLKTSDWQEIATAFAESGDPRFDEVVDADFRTLFSRIVHLASTPAEQRSSKSG